MTNQTFNIQFVLKSEKINKQGMAPIFARIRANGLKIELSTQRNIEPQNWSLEKKCALITPRLISLLNDIILSALVFSAIIALMSIHENSGFQKDRHSFLISIIIVLLHQQHKKINRCYK